jgi:hypothetical protein
MLVQHCLLLLRLVWQVLLRELPVLHCFLRVLLVQHYVSAAGAAL